MRTTLKIAGLSAGLAALLVAVVDLPQAAATVPAGRTVVDRLAADAAPAPARLTPVAPPIRALPAGDAQRDRPADACAKAVWPSVPDACLAAAGAPARTVRTIAIVQRAAPDAGPAPRVTRR